MRRNGRGPGRCSGVDVTAGVAGVRMTSGDIEPSFGGSGGGRDKMVCPPSSAPRMLGLRCRFARSGALLAPVGVGGIGIGFFALLVATGETDGDMGVFIIA